MEFEVMEFEVGDLVICIMPDSRYLKEGQTYKVRSRTEVDIRVYGLTDGDAWFFANRFILAKNVSQLEKVIYNLV
jgi:hypothetical protein